MLWNSTYRGEPTRATIDIPNVIYQTYHTRELIPQKVYENFKKYAPKFQRYVYNDSECLTFIRKHFQEAVYDDYHLMEAAHRADMFRYAILYIHGGVYIDIKTELLTPLVTVIPVESDRRDEEGRGITYTVLSSNDHSCYQGFIASPPGNTIFLKLILDLVQTKKPFHDYLVSTRKFYKLICTEAQKSELIGGMNIAGVDGGKFDYFLFVEKKRPVSECYDGADRHGGCYFIYREDSKEMKVRYADYPWRFPRIEK